MSILVALASLAWIVLVLADGFVAMVLPRRVTHTLRFTRFFYRLTWALWSAVARRMAMGRKRETFLSLFGPLSLLALLAFWVVNLIAGFAVLHWALGTPLKGDDAPGLLAY